MCSRYCLISPHETVRAVFATKNAAAFPPRYNIAPTQPVGIVRRDATGAREFALVRWGLMPSWSKDPLAFGALINARAETALDKPSFRGAMRYRRCLVPADGFYEWRTINGAKRPFLIKPRDDSVYAPQPGGPIAFAGLWETWLGADGSEIDTMAILTTPATSDLGGMHERMPVILAPDMFSPWLDCAGVAAKDAAGMLMSADAGSLVVIAVNTRLNDARNEGPELHAP